MNIGFKLGSLALLAAAGSLYAPAASAGTVTMLLVRSSLDSDPDPSGNGLWQYEGGVVETANGTAIGHYIVTRRLTNSGTSPDNTAADSTTLFFSAGGSGGPPNTITLEGAWSYTTGGFTGSVSATSARYRPLLGTDAVGVSSAASTTKLTLDYTGMATVP